MDKKALQKLLESVRSKTTSIDTALLQIKDIGFDDMGFAKVDHHRALRKGHPEVIFCQNKSIDHVVKIVKNQIAHNETVLGTRASEQVLAAVKKIRGVQTNPTARCFWKKAPDWQKSTEVKGTIIIAAAGTADASVAEEARVTAEILGHPVETIYDVGVAGIHRLFAYKETLQNAAVIIAIAGMEGALPSVIAGLVACPVIGVPTSVGYGSHLNGLVPLFAMLNSCASGLTVVNIDNGFGAAFAAVMINKK